jgi:hypothetical protein
MTKDIDGTSNQKLMEVYVNTFMKLPRIICPIKNKIKQLKN